MLRSTGVISCVLAILVAAVATSQLHAKTKMLPKGPPAVVTKSVEDHLIQIYVTPPTAQGNYVPGEFRVFLSRHYPDYLRVPLEAKRQKDGRLHVQIAITPDKFGEYSIMVHDEKTTETLLLYLQDLVDVPELTDSTRKK